MNVILRNVTVMEKEINFISDSGNFRITVNPLYDKVRESISYKIKIKVV